jgi:hypothetical protein
MVDAVPLFAAFVVAHLVADYPGQGDFLARAKNASAPIPGVPWRTILASHAAIHGAAAWAVVAVFLALGGMDPRAAVRLGLVFGVAEAGFHATIDHLKCTGRLGGIGEGSFNRDQLLHLACKALWTAILLWVLR